MTTHREVFFAEHAKCIYHEISTVADAEPTFVCTRHWPFYYATDAELGTVVRLKDGRLAECQELLPLPDMRVWQFMKHADGKDRYTALRSNVIEGPVTLLEGRMKLPR